jgi:hypothetical protein
VSVPICPPSANGAEKVQDEPVHAQARHVLVISPGCDLHDIEAHEPTTPGRAKSSGRHAVSQRP